MAIYGGPELARELAVEFTSMFLTLYTFWPHMNPFGSGPTVPRAHVARAGHSPTSKTLLMNFYKKN